MACSARAVLGRRAGKEERGEKCREGSAGREGQLAAPLVVC